MQYSIMNKKHNCFFLHAKMVSGIKETSVPQPISIGEQVEMHTILLYWEHLKNLFTNLRPIPYSTL